MFINVEYIKDEDKIPLDTIYLVDGYGNFVTDESGNLIKVSGDNLYTEIR